MSFRYNTSRPSGSSYQSSSYGSSSTMPGAKAYTSSAKPSYSSAYSKPTYSSQTSKPDPVDTSVRSGYDSLKRFGDSKYDTAKNAGNSKPEAPNYRSESSDSKLGTRSESSDVRKYGKREESEPQSRFGYTRYDAKTDSKVQPRSESKDSGYRLSDSKDTRSRYGKFGDTATRDSDTKDTGSRYSRDINTRDNDSKDVGTRYGASRELSTPDKSKDTGSRYASFRDTRDGGSKDINRYGSFRDTSNRDSDAKDNGSRYGSVRDSSNREGDSKPTSHSSRYGEAEKEPIKHDYSSLPRSYSAEKSPGYTSRFINTTNDTPKPYVRKLPTEVVSPQPEETAKDKDPNRSYFPTYRPRYSSRFLSTPTTPTYSRSNSSQDGFTSPVSALTSPTSPTPTVYSAVLQIPTARRPPVSPSRSPAPVAPSSPRESPDRSSSSEDEDSSEEEEDELVFNTCRSTSPNVYACDPDPKSISAEAKIEKSPQKLSTICVSHKEAQTENDGDQPRRSRFIGYTGYSGPSYSSYTPSRPTSTYYDKYLSRNFTSNLSKYRDEPKEEPPKKSPSPLALKPPPSPSVKVENGDIKEKIKAGILDVLMYTSLAGRSLDSVKRSPPREKTTVKPPVSPVSFRKNSRSPSSEYQLKPSLSPSSYRKIATERSPSTERFGKPPVSPSPRKNSSERCLSSKLTPPRCISSTALPPVPKRHSIISQQSSSDASSESETESSSDSKSSSKRGSLNQTRPVLNLPPPSCDTESSEEETSESSKSSKLPSPLPNGSNTKIYLNKTASNGSRSSLLKSGSNHSRLNGLQRNGSSSSRIALKPNSLKSTPNSSRGNLAPKMGSKDLLQRSTSNASRSSMLERSGSNASRSSLVQKSPSNSSRGNLVQRSPSNLSSRRSSSASSANPPQLISSFANSRSNSKSSLKSSSKLDSTSLPKSKSSAAQLKTRSSSSEQSKTSSSSSVSHSAPKQREPISSRSKSSLVRPPISRPSSIQRRSSVSSEASSRRGSISEAQSNKVVVPQSSFATRSQGVRRSSTLAFCWDDVPELSTSPEVEKLPAESDDERSSASELPAAHNSEEAPSLPPPHEEEPEKRASSASELGDRTSPDGFEWPDEPSTPPPAFYSRPFLRPPSPYDNLESEKEVSKEVEKSEVICEHKSEHVETSYESASSDSDEESLDEALSKAVGGKEEAAEDETEDEESEAAESSEQKSLPNDELRRESASPEAVFRQQPAQIRRRKSDDSSVAVTSSGKILEAERLSDYLRRLDAVNRISDHLAGSSSDEVEDATLQVYKDGDYGAYLDLESSMAEQADELEGFLDNRKNSIVLRTQLSVRVHAIIEKLLSAEGRELRRALFALKQIFQDDKDLVHAFVENDGLSCLVKVGKEADQNYQNYILRALGQVMLYVDGMHGVMEHSDTIRWLYELLGSKYRLVVKTALKLLLVFAEYVESNCQLLITAIHEVDTGKGQMAWTGVMKLLDDADATDTELVIYAVTLINKTLHGLPDQDSFYDETDCLEELQMQTVIKKYLSRPGADLDLLQQFQLYEAELRREDGDDSPSAILPAIQPMARSTPRTKRNSDGFSNRRKSRRHLLACGDDSATSSPSASPKALKPPMEFPSLKTDEHDEESVESSSRSSSPAVFDTPKMQVDTVHETPLIRRRRQRADRQRIFLREQGLRLGSDGESSMTDDSSASIESRLNQERNPESQSPLSTSPCVEPPIIPVRRLSSKQSLASNESQKLEEKSKSDEEKRPIELSREMTVKDITEKLKLGQCVTGGSLGSPSEEKPGRLGDLSGIISKAKEGLTKSKSKNDLKAEALLQKPEVKKSENELQWEQLVQSLNRPLNICDLDFTDLREADDTDPLCLGFMNGIPPPPPPMMNGGLPPPCPPPRMPFSLAGGPPLPPARGMAPPPVFGVKLTAVKSNENVPALENGIKSPKKTKKTVKLFWKEARDGNTIWDDVVPIQIDTQKLEHLFEQRCAKDLAGKKIAEGAKNKEVIVLDPKRSNAINIALTKLPPARAIKAAILKMDATVINREGIEKLLALLPSDEEKLKIEEAARLHADVPLGSAEQFLLTLSSIAELLARLKLWAFRLDYENLEKEIAEPLMDLKIGIDSLKNSKTFKEILATLLTIGNYLNGSQARGFQIDYLAKVPEVKDTVNKHSLLHHLCSIIMEKYPETSDLYSEIGPITRASRVDFEELATSLGKLESDCKASWDHLRAIGKHEQQANIKVKMSEFLSDCAERIIVLGIIYRRVLHRFQSFMVWLGTPIHIVRESKPGATCRIIAEFALEYRTTRERVLSQLEKRAAHRERNKTRGKMITEVGTFRREEERPVDRADAQLRHILGSDMSDTESMSVRGTLSLSLGRRNKPAARLSNFGRSTSSRDGTSDACTSDAEDAILESLVKTVTAPSRPAMRERKRTRNADRKSLRRTLMNDLTEDEKRFLAELAAQTEGT